MRKTRRKWRMMSKAFAACFWLVLACSFMAAKPVGCGGNLTDNCLKDLDCRGGHFCKSGVCTSMKVTSTPDSGPSPERKTSPDTHSKPDAGVGPERTGNESAGPKTCRDTGCPTGQYCSSNGKCYKVVNSGPFCDFPVDTNGLMTSAPTKYNIRTKTEARFIDPSIVISPNGEWAAVSLGKVKAEERLKLVSLKNGSVYKTLALPGYLSMDAVPLFTFSADGKTLYGNLCLNYSAAIAHGKHCMEMMAWSIPSGTPINLTKTFGGKVKQIAVSRNGLYTATIQEHANHNDPALMIWKKGNSKPLKIFPLATKERGAAHTNRGADDICRTDANCWKNEYCKSIGRGYSSCYVKNRKGHHLGLVTGFVVTNSGVVVTGDYQGALVRWDLNGAINEILKVDTYRIISELQLSKDQLLVTVGMYSWSKNTTLPRKGQYATLDLRYTKLSKPKLLQENIMPVDISVLPGGQVRFRGSLVKYVTYSKSWGIWYGDVNRRAHMEYPGDSTERSDIRATASSPDKRIRVAAVIKEDKFSLHVWRCVNPCQGKKCTNGTVCRYGRCVNPAGNCKGSEVRACYSGDKSQLNIGVCQSGTEVCFNGYWRNRCFKEVTPTKEICNRKDDDCDGQIDNKCVKPCKSDSYCSAAEYCAKGLCTPKSCKEDRNCARGFVCEQGKCTKCFAEKEVCDGKDNDCDGAIDEGCSCSKVEFRACSEQLSGYCMTGPGWQVCTKKYSNTPLEWSDCFCQASHTCHNDKGCSTGMFCDKGKCRTKMCKTNADCPTGYPCQYGVCTKTQCTKHADCSKYGKNTQCAAGICIHDR